MISGILDFFVSDLPERTVHMTAGCPYGEDNALTEIDDGTEVTFVNGRRFAAAAIRFRSGGECFHDSFEMGAPLARQLGLPSGRRYKLAYDPDRKTIEISRAPVSAASGTIRQETKLSPGSLSIGYGLLIKLGLPDDRPSFRVNVKHGSVSRRLAVRSPSNLFEDGLRMNPAAARALRLSPGKTYRLSYDQRTGEMVFAGAPGRPGFGTDVRKGTSDASGTGANRPGDAGHAGGERRPNGAGSAGGAIRPNGADRSDGVGRPKGANRSGSVNKSDGLVRPRRSGTGGTADAPLSRTPRQTPAPARLGRDRGPDRAPGNPAPSRDRHIAPAPPAAERAMPRRQDGAARRQAPPPERAKPPAPVLRAALRTGSAKASGRGGPSAPYMPKGRAL